MSNDFLSFEEFLAMILNVLDKTGIEYMLGGAIAVWPWGEPRSTQDVDIVIHLKAEQVPKLSEELKKVEIFLPTDIIVENLYDTRGDLPLNAIHGYSGYKAEMFLVREEDALRQSAFARRVKVDFGQAVGSVFVHSPEDIIIYKLLYYALSQQTKHVRDIGSILKIRGDELDYAYIEKWVSEKELTRIWDEIRRASDV
jgi:hypothetical protein